MARPVQGSARRLIGQVAVTICLAATVSHSALAQDDSFARQRDSEATKNASTGFSISFADDRRAFHPGEPIQLRFAFRMYGISAFSYEHCDDLGLADAVLDHSDGTTDPQADLWNNGIIIPVCGLVSGVVGGIAGSDRNLDLKPIEFAVYLNQAVRFDHPELKEEE